MFTNKLKKQSIFIVLIFTAFFVRTQCLQNQIFTVFSGFFVTMSEKNSNTDCQFWYLDNAGNAWAPTTASTSNWVQISSGLPQKWIAVVTQGRPTSNQWVTSYQVKYTLDGRQWIYVDGGRIFSGNSDRNSWVRQNFTQPIRAISIRIYPQTWHGYSAMRFDAVIASV